MRGEDKLKFKTQRSLVPVSVPCYDWKDDAGEASRKTVIIAPVKIVEWEDGNTKISWGCSRAVSCRDQNCRYSHANPKYEG